MSDIFASELYEQELTRTFVDPCINWNWYTTVQFHADRTVTILEHYRLHRYDHADHPSYVAGVEYRIVEDEERTVTALGFRNSQGEQTLPVRNQQYIFSYATSELTKQRRNW